MKTGKTCNHCGGIEFFKATVYAGGLTGSMLPVGLLHGPKYDNVICGECGHTEWFVSQPQLHLVREKLERAI